MAALKQRQEPTYQRLKNALIQSKIVADKVHIGDVYNLPSTSKLPKELTARIPTIAEDKVVGRTREIEDLHQRLFANKQVVVVNGLGGLGKTTLAQVYVSKYIDAYQHIAWVSQLSASFENDFVTTEGICESLDIDRTGKDIPTLFNEILQELKAISDKPNLLILDNADHTLVQVYDYLLKQPNWHILVTSRERIERFDIKNLDFLSEEDAIELFLKHYILGKLSKEEIKALVQTVDRHTLTVEILTKTAQKQRTPIDQLKRALKDDLQAKVFINHRGSEIDKIKSYLTSIFKLSNIAMEGDETWLLKQMICLPPEFHTYDDLVELINPQATERESVFATTLNELTAKGWLLYNADTDSYKMHRIIAEVTAAQVSINVEDILPLLENITKKLSFDQTKDNPIHKFPWIPYGKAILEHIAEENNPDIAVLQNNLALVLQDLGDYKGAKTLLQKALASDEQNFGEHHPTTAVRYSNLALVLQDLGDYEGAKTLLQKALASDVHNFGENHPATARSYSNLATVLKDLGDYEGAKNLLEKALASAAQNFGEHHPTTAVRYSNLALVLKDLGDYEGAKNLLEKTLASDEHNFGENHPATARSYSNLATVLKDLGDYEGAKNLLQKVMNSMEKNFGLNHPTTAVSYSNLAVVLKALGDYAGAKTLLQKALASDEQNFGEHHPNTAVSYSDLATVFYYLQDFNQAIALLEKAY